MDDRRVNPAQLPRMPGPSIFQLFVSGAVLLILVGLVYLPGIEGPLLLDDKSSLGGLSRLAISPGQSPDFIFGDASGPLGRSVAMASFALEKIYLGDSSLITKTVNVYLHALNALLVFWLFFLLFGHYQVRCLFLGSLLFACFWVFAPLQVSTVLYAVQRMAMLSASFSLIAFICYLYFRRSPESGYRRIACLLGFFVAFSLALLSKENAVVVLPIVVLLELLWIDDGSGNNPSSGHLRQIAKLLLVAGLIGSGLLLFGLYDWLLASYDFREFTLRERLLTQTRVLWDYTRQLYYPDMTRLGLYHDDYVVSKSLSNPVTTLWAAIAWVCVLICALWAIRFRYGRWLAFSVLFFLVAHATESTVWPLEIYFEHRNYLPSVGLVLLLAGGYACVAERWPPLAVPLLAWLTVYLLILVFQAGSQVQIWSRGPLLAMNHVNGHPESARANADMAAQLALAGDLETALGYSEKVYVHSNAHPASASESAGDREIRDIVLSCMSRKPLPGGYTAAIGSHDLARPFSSVQTFHTLVRMLQGSSCPGFDRQGLSDRLAQLYLSDNAPATASPNMYSLLAGFENSRAEYRLAYRYTEKFLDGAPGNNRGLLMQLHFTTALALHEEAAVIKQQLLTKRDAGRLSIGEEETLALYLDD